MMFLFHSSTLVLLALVTAAPGSDAFRNGNSPQATQATSKEISKPPMAFKWPFVGTLPDFFARGGVDGMCEVHESMYRDYGPVYGMSLMGDDELVVSDPRVFDQILRKEGRFPVGASESVTTFTEYFKENDLNFAMKSSSRGPDWKEWRSGTNPDMFVLWDTYLPVLAETCAKISGVAGKEVTETKSLHITEFLSRAAFDMFSAVLYGESPETTNTDKADPDDIAFVEATKRAFDITGNLLTNPLEKAFGGDLYKEFVVNMDKTYTFASQRGKEKIKSAMDAKALHEATETGERPASASADGENQSENDSSSGCPIAAIQATMSNNNKKTELKREKVIPTDFLNPSYIERLVNRENFSGDQIAEAAAPLLMAGVDTTAYVMSWFYLNMASNPDVQTKLAQELRVTLKGADVTTLEQMESLTYLKSCFRESHRLTPPAPMNIKTLEEDIDVVVGNKAYKVPAGQRISLNLRGLPIDPNYVENPMSFVPERFSPEAVAARKGTPSETALDHPYMNDPFGRGKRRCLGANVAIAEMMVLAARLIQDWEISLVDPNDAVQSPSKSWQTKQKLMLLADPYPAMNLVPRKQ